MSILWPSDDPALVALRRLAQALGFEDEVPYGDPVCSLAGGYPDDWLAAAVLAGHIPTLRGICLALVSAGLNAVSTDGAGP